MVKTKVIEMALSKAAYAYANARLNLLFSALKQSQFMAIAKQTYTNEASGAIMLFNKP